MALGRYHTLRNIYRTLEIRELSTLLGSSRNNSKSVINDTKCWSNSTCLYKWPDFTSSLVPHITLRSISSCIPKDHGDIPWTSGDKIMLSSSMTQEPINYGYMRTVTTQAKAPAQARKMGAVKLSMLSPGIIHEPYAPRDKIPFWKRYFTRDGWKRTKEDLTSELKSAYAIAKLRKAGYSKQKFYTEAVSIYKEINSQMAIGGKATLRKLVTENMYSALKNEIKQRESVWPTVYWELIEPIVKVRTLRARLIGVDRDDLSKVFIQLTLEFLSKQKFEAYDGKGAVVSGDRNKESLAAEATKPVTLGDSMDHSSVNTSQPQSNPGNGNHSSNEHALHSEDSSSCVVPKLEEAVVEDDSVLKNGESDLSQVTSEENEGDKIVEEEAPGPSMGTQNKAPKKMVSINDNVEEIYFSKKKKKKKKSTEKVSSVKEQVKEELKPLKSILKMGSNVNENWNEK